ncbi:MAG: carbohydrate ABC transporter permease [Treponema sp.]|jgi:putative aldouronate transport system permease protein|nr:carbohydrate ABC transporter permease [Treponema sp.]
MNTKRGHPRIELFDIVNYILMVCMMFVMLFPFWYSVAGSLNEGMDYLRGGIYFWPRAFTLANYHAVFKDKTIWNSFFVSAAKSILGSLSACLVTALAAYAMSRPQLKMKKFYAILIAITMYFGGGLIPYFILINNLGLYNSFWVYIIPGLFSVWNMIIFRSFFVDIPGSLIESAKIDGANEYHIFFRIIIPLSKAVLAAILLFSMVGHWNSYFDSMMYTSSSSLQTIQLFLKRVITDSSAAASMAGIASRTIPAQVMKINPQTLKLAAMVVTAFPILCVYPFLQKYFVKGVLIGSVKQ